MLLDPCSLGLSSISTRRWQDLASREIGSDDQMPRPRRCLGCCGRLAGMHFTNLSRCHFRLRWCWWRYRCQLAWRSRRLLGLPQQFLPPTLCFESGKELGWCGRCLINLDVLWLRVLGMDSLIDFPCTLQASLNWRLLAARLHALWA